MERKDSDGVNTTCIEWPTDPSQYEWIGKIGQGAFASVWRARTTVAIKNTNNNNDNHNLKTGEEEEKKELGNNNNSNNNNNNSTVCSSTHNNTEQECAIKVLNLDHVDSNLSEIRLEVQSMRLSSHPNVLSCFAAFVQSTDLWLVTKLMRKGSSLHCLQSARRVARSRHHKTTSVPIKMEKHILYIMHETLLGLQYIHEHNGQIHRDIKAGNILIDQNGDVRIADFGVSGWLVNDGTQQEKAKTFVGTPCWMVRLRTKIKYCSFFCNSRSNLDPSRKKLMFLSFCYCFRRRKLWNRSMGMIIKPIFGHWE
jgi:serine/threonine-protein kinase OSR1/STK39